MVALLAVGVLDKTTAFQVHRLSEELIREKVRLHRKNFRFWMGLSYRSLEAVRRKIWHAESDMPSRVIMGELAGKERSDVLDQVHLNSRLRALKHAFLPPAHGTARTTFTGAV
jgi:hypothetical protein